MAKKWNFFKGATAWEMYVGPVWLRWPFIKYLRVGCRPTFGIDRDN